MRQYVCHQFLDAVYHLLPSPKCLKTAALLSNDLNPIWKGEGCMKCTKMK